MMYANHAENQQTIVPKGSWGERAIAESTFTAHDRRNFPLSRVSQLIVAQKKLPLG
jgi:hypothetical protein